ncbi:chorismate-binding protein [bacterium]|nr:chorismate-binding protein [bacterium]
MKIDLEESPETLAGKWSQRGGVFWLDDCSPSPGWSYVVPLSSATPLTPTSAKGASLFQGEERESPRGQSPWEMLEQVAQHPPYDGPSPFGRGLVGWLSYDLGRGVGWDSPSHHPDWPTTLWRVEGVFAHHPQEGWHWTGSGDPPPIPPPVHEVAPSLVSGQLAVASDDRSWHRGAVEGIKERIMAGEMYEANLTFRLHGDAENPWELYRAFRKRSGSAYGAFFSGAGWAVGCGSPEMFLEGRGDRVCSEPMKGTASVGDDCLLEDPKERAELAIVVDLVRDDFHRCCRVGTVQVGDVPTLRHLPTVVQSIATIRGQLKEGVRPWEQVRALLPSGSVTGAPRSTVVPHLDKAEKSPRGIYCGALGWFADGGDIGLALPIRTFLWKDGALEYGVGGGITWRSTPEREWKECQTKAQALGSVLEGGIQW